MACRPTWSCRKHIISTVNVSPGVLTLPLSCRGPGRPHDHDRDSSHPSGDFQGSRQSPGDAQDLPYQTAGVPEQSPLGRSPSNRTYSSANHLLNFQSYSNDHYSRGGRGGHEGRGRGGYRRPAAKPMPYNRNKFLQANFRFLVSDAGNLKKHEADADLMLDWDDVVQARPFPQLPDLAWMLKSHRSHVTVMHAVAYRPF